MELINQRTNFDCTAAALAMFFGYKYDDFLSKYFADYKFDRPVSYGEELKIFHSEGARYINVPTWTMPKCKCIAVVPSMNWPGKLHSVFYDGENLFDPQANREGKKHYDNPNKDFVITGAILDLNDRVSLRFVSNEMWALSYNMTEALSDKDRRPGDHSSSKPQT